MTFSAPSGGISDITFATLATPTETINQYYPVVNYNANASPASQLNATFDGLSAVTQASFTGPNSIASEQTQAVMPVSSSFWFPFGFSSTWSGAAGTVDIAIDAGNFDGAPSAGNWNFNVYISCAASNAVYTNGTASGTTPAVPPSTSTDKANRYLAAAVNLPGSCAAGIPARVWVQRVADTGGTTGARPYPVGVLVTVRGN
jgi:hypothetical protein